MSTNQSPSKLQSKIFILTQIEKDFFPNKYVTSCFWLQATNAPGEDFMVGMLTAGVASTATATAAASTSVAVTPTVTGYCSCCCCHCYCHCCCCFCFFNELQRETMQRTELRCTFERQGRKLYCMVRITCTVLQLNCAACEHWSADFLMPRFPHLTALRCTLCTD